MAVTPSTSHDANSSCHSPSAPAVSVAAALPLAPEVMSVPQASEDFIFTFAPKDRHPLSKCTKNPKTSRTTEIEEDEALEELGHRVYEVAEPSAKALYSEFVDAARALDFLKSAQSGYDMETSTWTILPSDSNSEEGLRRSLVRTLNAIARYFEPSLPAGTTREAVDSHDIPMAHDNGTHFTSPAVCIKASGSSFEVPEHAERSGGLGYTNVTAVLDVRLDRMKGKRIVHCKRLAAFNRQIFIQQPNRHYARSLLVTEKAFRLVHHDHSGVYVTPLFDIHKDANLFVQFVAGLMSANEEVLGLDTSVQWTIDHASGKKVSGTINLDEYNEETGTSTTKAYELDMKEPPFVRPGIRGRGTVGWHARDPVTGQAVIVKDAWRTDSRESEYEFLLKAKDIPGIVDLLGYQDDCAQTAHYRPSVFEDHNFRNRFKLRLVLIKYGDPVWFFRSRLQLLCALRDVLIGHRELFERGIIHRDISVLNILLGQLGAPEGHRGILIDLDMAAYTEGRKSSLPADPYIGTRIYQSISVVRSLSVTPSPPQDYTDDLESLFYVFCHVVYDFEKPGVKRKDGWDPVKNWDNEETYVVSNAKTGFCLSATNLARILPYWGSACTGLMQEFHEVIRGIVREKDTIDANRYLDTEGKLKAYEAVAQNLDFYYGKVKSAFDKAIALLEKEGPSAPELEPYPEFIAAPDVTSSSPSEVSLTNEPTTPPPVHASHDRPRAISSSPNSAPLRVPTKKRPSEEHDDGAPHKRLRDATQGPSVASCTGQRQSPAGLP